MNNHQTKGYRGYIGSRAYDGIDFPQHIQNFLIRNYCQKNHLKFLLSATEYTMPGCHMILEEVVNSISSLDGIVLFSIFMLPASTTKRKAIYKAVLDANATLHAALEDICIKNVADIQVVEDILDVSKIALKDDTLAGLRDFCPA